MRTDSYVEKEEVVAVVLEDIASQLTFSCAEIKTSVEAGRLGANKKVSRDVLVQTATTTVITRHRTAWKRTCCTIKLSCLPQDVQSELKSGKLSMTFAILSSYTWFLTFPTVTNHAPVAAGTSTQPTLHPKPSVTCAVQPPIPSISWHSTTTPY